MVWKLLSENLQRCWDKKFTYFCVNGMKTSVGKSTAKFRQKIHLLLRKCYENLSENLQWCLVRQFTSFSLNVRKTSVGKSTAMFDRKFTYFCINGMKISMVKSTYIWRHCLSNTSQTNSPASEFIFKWTSPIETNRLLPLSTWRQHIN